MEHCWHQLSVNLTVYPIVTPERCCYCGAVRNGSRKQERPEGHGPFAPTKEGEYQWSYPHGINPNFCHKRDR